MNRILPLFDNDDTGEPAPFAANDRVKAPSRPRHAELSEANAAAEAVPLSIAAVRSRVGLRTPTRVYEWLLLLRFALVNVFAFALLTAAWALGYIDMVVRGDDSGISHAIALVFVGGWLFTCRAAVVISRDLNRVRRGDASFAHEPIENLKDRLSRRVGGVRYIANTLVLLGLIGTVAGFIVALSGVRPDEAGDASSIAPMVATLIHGMSIALYTTLVGSVFALWLMVLHRMLHTAASKLLCAARVAAYG